MEYMFLVIIQYMNMVVMIIVCQPADYIFGVVLGLQTMTADEDSKEARQYGMDYNKRIEEDFSNHAKRHGFFIFNFLCAFLFFVLRNDPNEREKDRNHERKNKTIKNERGKS